MLGNSTNWDDRWRDFFEVLFGIGLLLAGIVMALLFASGFWIFAQAVLVSFGALRAPEGTEFKSYALVEALKGLEYFFLAPLAYLVFYTLIRFLRSALGKEDEAASEERRMLAMKGLTMSFLIAVVATDLVSKIFGPKGLSLESAGAEILVMVTFAGYYVLLERHRRI